MCWCTRASYSPCVAAPALSPPIPYSRGRLAGAGSHSHPVWWQPFSLLVLSPFLIKFFSCNKHDHHLSFQTSQVSVQDLAFGVCWLNILPGKRTAPVAPANYSDWNSLLHLGASSALRTELSSLTRGPPVSQMLSAVPAPHPQNSLLRPGGPWPPEPCEWAAAGWQGSPTRHLPQGIAGATGDCWCVLQAQSPVTAFCVTGFQLKPAERSSWHFAAHESKVPPQPGRETPSA